MSSIATPDSGFSVLTTSRSGDVISRRAGLLRLFRSDFFDSGMAVGYLWKYNKREVGVQFAVCEKLKAMPVRELEFLLPQLCHLAVCNIDESPSLEHLLLDLCQRSLHAAIFVLCNDFRLTFAKNPNVYLRSVRLLSELQKIIFREHISATGRLSRSLSSEGDESTQDSMMSKIKTELAASNLPGIAVSMVGAGCAMAGVGLPEFTNQARPMVMTEARRIGFGRHPSKKTPIKQSDLGSRKPFNTTIPSVEELHSGSAFSFRDYVIKAAKHMQATAPKLITLSGSSSLATSGDLSRAISAPGIPPPVPLYYYTEMQFVMSLIDTSMRLVSVVRDSRLKALHAELALINHNLPASLCLPLWCRDSSHHRILRISPCDAVVLNSAERVPFLLQIEVLTGDYTDTEFQEMIKSALDQSPSQSIIGESIISSEQPLEGDDEGIVLNEANVENEENVDIFPVPDFESDTAQNAPLSADDFADRMRTAAIMLAQLTRRATRADCSTQALADMAAIKDRIIKEMETLERNRLLDAIQQNDLGKERDTPLFLDQSLTFDREDPSAAVFQEGWDDKVRRIKAASPFGALEGWTLYSVIVKSGSDMRQEQLATQIISEMTDIWKKAGLPLWTFCYRVLVASCNGGLIETVPNAISLHSIKKNAYMKNADNPGYVFSLRDHFIKMFGSPDSEPFQGARECFTNSLAAYSIVTYLLQVKDRHDGNILLDNQGHLVHIDFGFMLSNSPGYMGFESAPFKLTPEYIELLGGLHSPEFAAFQDSMFNGFLELRKHVDKICVLIEIMQKDSRLPCFYSGESAIAQLRQRFHLTLTDAQLRQVVDRLVISSAYNIFTKLYDTFQYYSNGIL